MRDFLAVRGAAVLILVAALEGLKSAFAQYESPQRLLLVAFIYLMIVLALFLGTVPFYWRNFHEWLYRDRGSLLLPRVLGSVLTGYGLLLCIVTFTY
ncbi:MAG: hypothetical protein LR015_00365 [Verrucomicrobia bacterium]|nr:hypothetical protein [Verrucomicrobiota bacterium]